MSSIQQCQACGASVYPEHVDEGRAGRWAGQLLCPACYAEKRGAPAAVPAVAPAAPAAPAAPPPLPKQAEAASEEEPISLVEESGTGGGRIQALGQIKLRQERTEFNRKLNVTGRGATRMRTFHSKIQAESIEFMDNAINEWLDDNPDIEIKFVSSTIGTMAGKFPEPNIILNLWY